MPRSRILFILLLTLVATGCSHPDAKNAVITQPPAPENITVDLSADLGLLEAHTTPLLRPNSANPSDALLAALKPLLTDPIPTLITLGDTVKFDNRFPGDKKDWARWDAGVEKLVRQNLAAKKLVEYEIWNEPDLSSSFKGNQAEFFAVWFHTVRLIWSIDPQAQLVGPSRSSFDAGWIQEFLKIGKEYDVPTTIVCWHESSVKPDLLGHVNSAGEMFWQDGVDRHHIRILPSNALDRTYCPSDPVLLLAQLQQAWRDSKFRHIDERFAIKLHHLVANNKEPRSLYHAYVAYADLIAHGGRAVKLSSAKNTDGLATWDATSRTARILLGRNASRSATTQPTPPGQPRPDQLGPLTLVLKDVSGSTAHVAVTVIANSGEQPFTPAPPRESEIPVIDSQVRLPLIEMTSGQAYVIQVKIAGPAPATTRSTTQPTTQR
jgi:hypothetical protein